MQSGVQHDADQYTQPTSSHYMKQIEHLRHAYAGVVILKNDVDDRPR